MSLRLILLIVAYASTIPVANWMIGNVGMCGVGPCVIPVAPGLYAPSGVLIIGVGLVLRDVIHDEAGQVIALLAISIGALVSLFASPHGLVLASVAAFTVGEMADMLVYTPMRVRGRKVAVLLSGIVGATVDSAIFLWIAFESLDFMAGQIIGKSAASFVAVALIGFLQLRRAQRLAEKSQKGGG